MDRVTELEGDAEGDGDPESVLDSNAEIVIVEDATAESDTDGFVEKEDVSRGDSEGNGEELAETDSVGANARYPEVQARDVVGGAASPR